MENRFGVKDFFLYALLLTLIIVVFFAMQQFDRQYQLVRSMKDQGQDQFRELVAIHSALERGVNLGGPTTQSSSIEPDPFAKLRAMRNAGKYDQGDWYVQNLQAHVAKLTPLLSTDIYAEYIQARVMEGLLVRDPESLAYTPLLATAWQIKDNTPAWQAYIEKRKVVPITEAEIVKESDCPPDDKAADRKTYITNRLKEGRRDDDISAEPDCPVAVVITFQLRHGVTFSDGSPFSADDVVFTYDFTMNPKVEAPRDRQALERIKSVKKNSDYEVAFNFREPYFASLELAGSIGIMSKAFYSQYTPEQFNDSVGLLIGTGPYRLASPVDWKPTPDKIELLRNDRYWGLPSSFDKLVYRQVEADSTSLVLYTNGETDVFNSQPSQYQLLLKRPDIMNRSQNFEYLSPISGYNFIAWNQNRNGKSTIFTDKRVRQAMTLLTDRDSICKNIFLGYATPASGPFSPLSKQNDTTLADWPYDPEKAKLLLKQAGFEIRDSTGILKMSDGTPLSFKLCYGNKNETYERVMQLVKDGYNRAGVDCELDPVDWAIIEQRIKLRDFDVISLGWAAGIEDDIYQMFDSSQIPNEADNFMSYSSPELDASIRLARRTLDEPKRMELWHKAQQILHDEQPYTFLMLRKSLRFFDKRLENIHTASTGINWVQEWTMAIPWSVPAGSQKYTK